MAADRLRYMVAWWPEDLRVEVVPWPDHDRLSLGAMTYGDCNFGPQEFHNLDDHQRARRLRDLALQLISEYGLPVAEVFQAFADIPEWRTMRMRGGWVAFLPGEYDRLNLYNP